jgi:hypothetical protein
MDIQNFVRGTGKRNFSNDDLLFSTLNIILLSKLNGNVKLVNLYEEKLKNEVNTDILYFGHFSSNFPTLIVIYIFHFFSFESLSLYLSTFSKFLQILIFYFKKVTSIRMFDLLIQV